MISIQNLIDINGNGLTSTLISSKQALDVNIAGGTLTVGSTDSSTFTAGSSTFSPDGGVFNDSLSALTSGQQGTNRMTAYRAFHVNLRNNSGAQVGDSQTDALNVLIGDGTTGVYVAPASTAVGAAHPALSVGLSPNSPLPAGLSTTLLGGVALYVGSTIVSASNPVNTQDLADGPVSPGTAATKSLLGGMVYNSAAPTPTTGQQLALQSDSAGNLKVTLAASSDATAIPVTNANDNSSTATAPSAAAQALTAATDLQVLASNTARKGFILVNAGTTPIFIGLGAAASASNWNFQLMPGATYEPTKNYTGAIHAFSTLANSIHVTELT